MPKININVDQAADIVVKVLKKDYKMIRGIVANTSWNEDVSAEEDLLLAIGSMLKYYMVESDAEAWMAKQEGDE